MVENIGVPGVIAPSKECNDVNCPFHGSLKVRGRIIQGVVVSKKMVKTITIQRNYNFYVKKFQRYERRNTKQSAHVPECMEVEIGDVVRIMETRPLSKTISFVVIEKMKQEGVK